MKTIKQSIFYSLLILALVFTSCKKDDEGGGGPSGGEGTMTAKVNGETKTATFGVTAMLSGGALAVSGGTSDAENLQVIIQSFEGVGTYNLNFSSIGTYSYAPDPSNPDPSTIVFFTTANGTSNNGEINISSYDGDNVQGTFSFTGFNVNNTSDTVSVTDGEFNINL